MGTNEGDLADARKAFALLGHDLRLETLLALLAEWEAVYLNRGASRRQPGRVGALGGRHRHPTARLKAS